MEVEQKEKLDMYSRLLEQELITLRSMEKYFNKVEKTKKRLEDDLAVYKVKGIGSYLALISMLRSRRMSNYCYNRILSTLNSICC